MRRDRRRDLRLPWLSAGRVTAFELASFPPGLLEVDRGRIDRLVGDEPALAGLELDVVAPGEAVRITHILDAVEPRIRPDGRSAFPTEGPGGHGADKPARRRGRPLLRRLPG